MDLVFERVGAALAFLYIGYGLFVLAGGATLCAHLLVLAALAWRGGVARRRWWVQGIEIVYGLVNPLLYLLFIERVLAPSRVAALDRAGWAMLALLWGLRLFGGFARFRRAPAARALVRAALVAGLLCVAAFLVKDFAGLALERGLDTSRPGSWPLLLVSVNALALYAIPALALWRHLRATFAEASWEAGRRFFLLPPRVVVGLAAVALATLLVATHHPSERSVRALLLAHRDVLVAAAQRHGVEPRLVASVVSVVQRDTTTPFARALERLAMGAWLEDPRGDLGLLPRFDLSLGIAQIKPSTAQAALLVVAATRLPREGDESVTDTALRAARAGATYKDYRGAPPLDERWRLPASALPRSATTDSLPASKREIVDQLFTDDVNLDFCALLLSLYAVQWETANPAWSLRRRPEILATLYQLGFERSVPKANPRAIPFGERVRAEFDSPWMAEHFAAP